MKKILLSVFCLFVAQNIYACPNLLNSDMRILDSVETQNLCAYEGKTLLVVTLPVDVVIPINTQVFKIYMKNIKMMTL